MNSLYERIEALCRQRQVSVTDMCRAAGIPRANLTDLKMGRQASLSTKNLEKAAAYFNTSVGSLLGWSREPDDLDRAVSAIPGYEDYDPAKETLPEYLARKAKKDPAPAPRPTVTEEDIKFALFGGDREITDEMYQEVKRFANYVKQKDRLE